LDRQMATLDQQIGALVAPLHAHIAQLDSIPGVDITAARDIIAEIGTDMSRFGDAARLASSFPAAARSSSRNRRPKRNSSSVRPGSCVST